MEVIFLGTGTSQGVPMIACDCKVCASDDPRDRRARSSIHVVMDGLHVQVDASPEFRVQCLRENINRMDFFILTHGHADHIAGMDDLRRFCDLRGGTALPVYTTREDGMARIRSIFPYAIGDRPAAVGYAAFDLREMPARMELPQGVIESVPLPHGALNTLGLVFTERSSGRKFVYYTDCKEVPAAAIELARGAGVVVLDGLRPCPHPSHMTTAEAVAVARQIGAPQTYLTHLTHLVGHEELISQLPKNVAPAHDGLRVVL
ncbi:phosphoribosyl 1,2-cyclic phosphate phosphodiesterase [Ereboglobus sp. PH5-10]|uniref:MBL fold metallo-hydrolase n=1 Tax=Ereboglobus sp. PH5-10 TaxID=2940629 RepID=UPI0024050023|nr:MBL fold metallo-hydrolase [Ereboglobus sp. PH5-10]MDF9827073.1 phosphoribosyl 1,2-cyclic phosphate phosphodiesterase [Ereboglobus sp. PH5-10]